MLSVIKLADACHDVGPAACEQKEQDVVSRYYPSVLEAANERARDDHTEDQANVPEPGVVTNELFGAFTIENSNGADCCQRELCCDNGVHLDDEIFPVWIIS